MVAVSILSSFPAVAVPIDRTNNSAALLTENDIYEFRPNDPEPWRGRHTLESGEYLGELRKGSPLNRIISENPLKLYSLNGFATPCHAAREVDSSRATGRAG